MIGPMVFTDDEAACREVDPEVFFPSTGQGSMRAMRVAKAICADCPLLEPCGDYALRHLEYGIWGAMSERQRRERRRELGIRAVVPPTVLATTPEALRKRQRRAA